MRTRIIDMIWGGLPVVTTTGDTMSDYLSTQRIGVTVSPENPVELASAIVRLLEDPEKRWQMSKRSRALAEGELSWDCQIESLHRFCLDPNFEPSRRDDLVRRTAANVVHINNGWVWRIRAGWRWTLWRAKNALHLDRQSRRGTCSDDSGDGSANV
jgi:hypothetical protein